jgi:mannosyl-oligosaccharide glucosidase
MWYFPEKMDSVKSMRHFMEISDNIKKYEWIAHNGCNYGHLRVEDPLMNVNFEVSFYNEEFSSNKNHWVVRIKGDANNPRGIVFMWYISNKSGKNYYGINYNSNTSALSGKYSDDKKFFVKSIQDKSNQHPIYSDISYDNEYYLVLNISEDKLYDPSEYIIGELKDTVGTTPNHLIDSKDSYRSAGVTKGNVFIQQVFFINNFSFDIHYFDNKLEESKITQEYVNQGLENKAREFNEKFSQIFEKNNKFSNKLIYSSKFLSQDVKPTAVSALSTLFSNMLYMNGNLQILDTKTNSIILSPNYELLTIGPDKTSHSRGFMWDEGFQQRVLSLWNLETSLKIVSNWFKNIDQKTGWLSREQSLDNESRSRAPPSSWASIPDVSNPPSLFLFINHLLDRKNDKKLVKDFLIEIIENLEKNAQWYIKNQQSNIQYIFSWKGKTDDFCLPSGLDDYPRCRLNGNNFTEGHVDLQSWMVSLSQTMIKIYSFVDESSTKYKERIKNWNIVKDKIFTNLINYFWDESRNLFDDFYIDKDGKKIFSGHTGYMQLFPLILDVFALREKENKKYIDATIDLIINPSKGLRTNYGIRSLSINDPVYKKGQNYWTSPIWINLNYLIIKSLNNLRSIPEFSHLAKEYEEIRLSVVNNMVKNFKENGFIWEVYDDMDGHGKYNHPFTGWSALIVNLIYEMF